MPSAPPIEFPWASYGLAAAAAIAVFLLAWPPLVRARLEAKVDVMWAAGIGVLGLAGAILGAGWAPRRLLAAVLPVVWGGRLAHHLWRRLARQGTDGRYEAMRASLGPRHFWAMGPFFLIQGILAAGLAMPWWSLAADAAPGWRPLEFAGMLLWLIALGGETLADRQLERWRRDPAHRGRTCRAGLWAWSRHPNYFFDWLGWCGVALLVWSSPAGWSGSAAAAVLLLLLTRVSGIPFTEQQALRTRGDDYRDYQRRVSAFFPRPPR